MLWIISKASTIKMHCQAEKSFSLGCHDISMEKKNSTQQVIHGWKKTKTAPNNVAKSFATKLSKKRRKYRKSNIKPKQYVCKSSKRKKNMKWRTTGEKHSQRAILLMQKRNNLSYFCYICNIRVLSFLYASFFFPMENSFNTKLILSFIFII